MDLCAYIGRKYKTKKNSALEYRGRIEGRKIEYV
jgi:hypothetical protein